MATVTDQLRRVLQQRDSARVSIIVESEPDRGAQTEDALRSRGVEYEQVGVRNKTVFETTVDRETLQQLSQEPSIAVLDHNPTFRPLAAVPGSPSTEVRKADSYDAIPLGEKMSQLGVKDVWEDFGTKGEGVTFGMVDSPIDDRHPALSDSVTAVQANPAAGTHGTWVASALVGSEFDSPEGAIHGGCPNAELVAHGALSGGGASVGEVVEGIGFCIDQEVDILNISFGGEHSRVLQNTVQEAIRAGITVVSSAGNTGPGRGTVTCPAHHADVTAIGSVGDGGEPAAFSSRGPGWNGAKKPDAVAYGGKTVMVGGRQKATEAVVGAAPYGDTAELIGTSMAAPEAASLLGLGLSKDKQEL